MYVIAKLSHLLMKRNCFKRIPTMLMFAMLTVVKLLFPHDTTPAEGTVVEADDLSGDVSTLHTIASDGVCSENTSGGLSDVHGRDQSCSCRQPCSETFWTYYQATGTFELMILSGGRMSCVEQCSYFRWNLDIFI